MTLKNQKNPYRYFLNLKHALSGDEFIDDAVEGISGNHRNRLSIILNDPDYIEFTSLLDITYIVNKYNSDSRLNRIVQLQQKILSFTITILDLPFGTSLIQIVETFERINRTGKPLTIFELLSAKLYQKHVKLYTLLEESIDDFPHVGNIEPELILRILCFIRNLDYSRGNILELSSENFESDWKRACKGFELAYKRLVDLQTGYGVYDINRVMPFSPMFIPLAAILLFMKENDLERSANYKKIDKWYWISVFGERYTQSTNSISYSDYKNLKEYLKNDVTPDFISSFNIDSLQIDVDATGSAIYRGIFCLLTLHHVKDYSTFQSIKIEPDKVQDDHIFPKSIYKDDSVLNRTLISTNQKKSKKKPSIYFGQIEKQIGKQQVLQMLETHFISEDGFNALLNDNIASLKENRKGNILKFLETRI